MAKFHALTVTAIDKTTRDAVVVTLAADPADQAHFDFRHGQYLTFRRAFGGQELRRSYSICSAPGDGPMQVGIKRVDGGAFSGFANTELRVGDRLEAMAPAGSFTTEIAPEMARNYLCFAAGSGITPILSIMRTVLAREPQSTVTLVYANRSMNTIMFREEVEDLKNRHMGRMTVIHILGRDAQDIDLFTGRITAEKCAALFRYWIDLPRMDLSLICGPEPLREVITDALLSAGMARENIRYELFAAGQQGRLPRDRARLAEVGGAQAARLTLTLDGATRVISMAPGQTLLEAALENAIDVPYACTAGVCSTCRCRVISGEVEMAANHALEDYEVRQGFALSCQSRPLTAEIEVEYDH